MLHGNKAPNVIFVPGYAQYVSGRDLLALETVLVHRTYKFLSCYKKQDLVAIKSCEHVPGRVAEYTHNLARLLRQYGQSGFFCGTSNRHLDGDSNAIVCTQHDLKAQASHDEVFPFRALDGLYGDYEISRKTHRRLDKDVYLAGELDQLDGLILVAGIMPSDTTQPLGSLVNLGQGLAAKKGKIYQRTLDCPQVNVTRCYKCRRCVRVCPTHAITIEDNHVVIDSQKCIKCGRCVETASHGGITYHWNATPEHYNDLVVKHAQGVLALLKDRIICIHIIIRHDGDESVFAGAMVSKNPVALDCATADFCEKEDLLPAEQIQQIRRRIERAESLGVGTASYEQETVAY